MFEYAHVIAQNMLYLHELRKLVKIVTILDLPLRLCASISARRPWNQAAARLHNAYTSPKEGHEAALIRAFAITNSHFFSEVFAVGSTHFPENYCQLPIPSEYDVPRSAGGPLFSAFMTVHCPDPSNRAPETETGP